MSAVASRSARGSANVPPSAMRKSGDTPSTAAPFGSNRPRTVPSSVVRRRSARRSTISSVPFFSTATLPIRAVPPAMVKGSATSRGVVPANSLSRRSDGASASSRSSLTASAASRTPENAAASKPERRASSRSVPPPASRSTSALMSLPCASAATSRSKRPDMRSPSVRPVAAMSPPTSLSAAPRLPVSPMRAIARRPVSRPPSHSVETFSNVRSPSRRARSASKSRADAAFSRPRPSSAVRAVTRSAPSMPERVGVPKGTASSPVTRTLGSTAPPQTKSASATRSSRSSARRPESAGRGCASRSSRRSASTPPPASRPFAVIATRAGSTLTSPERSADVPSPTPGKAMPEAASSGSTFSPASS